MAKDKKAKGAGNKGAGKGAGKKTGAGGGQGGGGKAGGGLFLLVFLALAAAVLVMVPAALLALVGLLPSAVAFIADRNTNRTAPTCVAIMNLAGVLPYVFQIVRDRRDFDAALTLLADPSNLLLMYGAAAAGWLIFFSVPRTVSAFIIGRDEARIRRLEAMQKETMELYGPDVDTTKKG